jgi:hypothetical protein
MINKKYKNMKRLSFKSTQLMETGHLKWYSTPIQRFAENQKTASVTDELALLAISRFSIENNK